LCVPKCVRRIFRVYVKFRKITGFYVRRILSYIHPNLRNLPTVCYFLTKSAFFLAHGGKKRSSYVRM